MRCHILARLCRSSSDVTLWRRIGLEVEPFQHQCKGFSITCCYIFEIAFMLLVHTPRLLALDAETFRFMRPRRILAQLPSSKNIFRTLWVLSLTFGTLGMWYQNAHGITDSYRQRSKEGSSSSDWACSGLRRQLCLFCKLSIWPELVLKARDREHCDLSWTMGFVQILAHVTKLHFNTFRVLIYLAQLRQFDETLFVLSSKSSSTFLHRSMRVLSYLWRAWSSSWCRL